MTGRRPVFRGTFTPAGYCGRPMDAAQLRPLSVGEILDLAIQIYRERFADLVKAAAVVVAPVAVLRALVQLSLLPDEDSSLFSGPVDATGQPTFEANEFWSLMAGLLLVGLVSLISSQLATGASFKLVSGAYLDEPPDWRASLSFATSRLGSLVWLTVLLGFLAGLGFLACIVPGVYLYVAWSVAVPVLLLENARGRAALKRSRALVRDRWWPTAGAILVSLILSVIVQGVVSGLLAVVVTVGDNDLVAAVAQAVADTVGTVLTTPFTSAVIAAVYFDLRVRKEGFDLELLARRVGVDPPAGGYRPVGPPPGWQPPPPAPPASSTTPPPPAWPSPSPQPPPPTSAAGWPPPSPSPPPPPGFVTAEEAEDEPPTWPPPPPPDDEEDSGRPGTWRFDPRDDG
jgi:hypothetical protein